MIAAIRNRLRPPWRADLVAVLQSLTDIVDMQNDRLKRLEADVAKLRPVVPRVVATGRVERVYGGLTTEIDWDHARDMKRGV